MDKQLRDLEREYKLDPSKKNLILLQNVKVRARILPEVCHVKICENSPLKGLNLQKFHNNGICDPCWKALTEGLPNLVNSAVSRMYRVERFEERKWYVIPRIPQNRSLDLAVWSGGTVQSISARIPQHPHPTKIPLYCANVWDSPDYADLRLTEAYISEFNESNNISEDDPDYYAFGHYACHVSWVVPYYGK